MEKVDRHGAAESLAAAEKLQHTAAAHSKAPWWYYPGVGVTLGAAVLFLSLSQSWAVITALAVTVVPGPLLSWGYRRSTGTEVGGGFGGRAAAWPIGWAIIVLAIIAGGFLLSQNTHTILWAWVAAMLILGFTIAYGRLFDRRRGPLPR